MSSLLGGSLYRGLVVPVSSFVLLALVTLVAWISWLQDRESLRRFERMAVTNAGFVDEMPLPRSRQMAGRLSSILGVEVGFALPGGQWVRSTGGGWPEETDLGSIKMFEGTMRLGGCDLAMVRLKDEGQFFVLSRETEGGLAGIGAWLLAPALVLTVTCGALVFLMAHRIVRPLTLLTHWLPNLQRGAQAEAIPAGVSKRHDEVGELARSLQDVHRRLVEEQDLRQRSERLATLGRIATSLAHEIRNPAAAIRMNADLLEHAGEEERSGCIELIGEEVDRITDLVNQWLFVARAAPPEKRPHDLVGLVGAVAKRLRPAMDHAGVRLRLEADGEHLVDCDRLRVEQVVRNLVVNAMQAMPGGGEVVVTVVALDGRVAMSVLDSGKGFSDEALEKFGEPFFSEREGGMGIGLTLSREVVEAHGGEIEAANPPGGGAEVVVLLPASKRKESS